MKDKARMLLVIKEGHETGDFSVARSLQVSASNHLFQVIFSPLFIRSSYLQVSSEGITFCMSYTSPWWRQWLQCYVSSKLFFSLPFIRSSYFQVSSEGITFCMSYTTPWCCQWLSFVCACLYYCAATVVHCAFRFVLGSPIVVFLGLFWSLYSIFWCSFDSWSVLVPCSSHYLRLTESGSPALFAWIVRL